MGGLARRMPHTATLAIVAASAMAGVPLLNGFLSKEMFFAETVFLTSHPWVEIGLPVLATVAAVFAVVYSLRFGYGVFFGALATDLPRDPEEAPRWMRLPIALLVLTCLVVGVAPASSIGPFLAAAARPVLGGVLPEYRGRGIYRALVARRAQLAIEGGYSILQVDASDDSRPILERLGLHVVGGTTPFVTAAPRSD